MKLFKKKQTRAAPQMILPDRDCGSCLTLPPEAGPLEKELFDRLRYAVPVIDAAIMKIIRLSRGLRLVCSDERFQEQLDRFCENVPVGLTGTSLGCFADAFLDSMLTYVTHEDSGTSSYIFVKNGSTQWDGIVNIAYKVYGKHPYIRGTNCVMVNRDSSAQTFAYAEASLLSRGSERDTRGLVYFWSMENMHGEYGDYTLTDSDAYDSYIRRCRYFELDRRFLYEPQRALEFRDKMAMRGWRRSFFTYRGYRGEDLFDRAQVGEVARDITSVRISGGRNGIITEIGMYSDKFVEPQ